MQLHLGLLQLSREQTLRSVPLCRQRVRNGEDGFRSLPGREVNTSEQLLRKGSSSDHSSSSSLLVLPLQQETKHSKAATSSLRALHAFQLLRHFEPDLRTSLQPPFPRSCRSSLLTQSVSCKRAQPSEKSSRKVISSITHHHVKALHVHFGSDNFTNSL